MEPEPQPDDNSTGKTDKIDDARSAVSPPLGAARAELLAWTAIGVVNLIAVRVASPLRRPSASLLLTRGAYDLGHVLALGLVSLLVLLGWARVKAAVGPRLSRRAAFGVDLAAVTAASYALAFPILAGDLNDFSATLAGERGLSRMLVRNALVLAVASGIPAAALAGRLAARPWIRWIAVAAAVGAAAANHAVLTADYPGAHLYLAWAAAVLGGAALATLPAPALPTRAHRIARHVALGAAALLAAWSVVSRPRAVVQLALLEERGSTLAPFLMRSRAAAAFAPKANVPPDLAPWFADRSRAPAVPPTTKDARKDQIVILYTIDALRADVIESGKYDARLPEFTRLKTEGVHFTQARSAGTGTSFALSALFMGKYYSEQYWSPNPKDGGTVYPWEDESIRWPDLLSARGIRTLAFVSRKFMLNEFGIARGFEESVFTKPSRRRNRAPLGRDLGEAALKRLAKHDGGPLFLWFHNMDVHGPFNMAKGNTSFERYVGAAEIVDKEFGRLRALIERKGWGDRTTYILSADHGEAFREHGSSGHSSNMYEEVLRIPLVVAGPGVKPRAVGAPVSIIDIGPTVLDLFGLPTPGSFLGQSLAPLLRGEDVKLTRPIGAETRLKQTLVLSGGLKLIRDQRLGTREIYDLAADPGEQHNLADDPGADREAQMSLLAAFFDEHTLKRPGYKPPYRTW